MLLRLPIFHQRIRLHGIDAPEKGQHCSRHWRKYRCGQSAAQALDGLIAGRPVSCVTNDRNRAGEPCKNDKDELGRSCSRDYYKRALAVCSADGVDLNAAMVEQGWALAYRAYSLDYVVQERLARRRKNGLWAGKFEKPWDWRHRR